MGLPKKIKIQRGYLAGFLLLFLSYIMIFYVIYELDNKTRSVTHSYDVINTLYSLKGEIIDAETGVRGYIITKDPRFLSPYHSGSKKVEPLLNQLKQLTSDNRSYRPRIDSLEKLISKKLEALTNAIESFQGNGMVITPDMTANRESVKSATDSIRLIVSQFINSEKNLRQTRDNRLNTIFSITKIIAIISLIITLTAAIISYVIYHRENLAKEKANTSVGMYAKELEENIHKLQTANQELLELKSLEKFAFSGRIARSIAHEVRNPLTNISLASEQLKEINTGNPDFTILLEMINRNAARINQLVSELLTSTRFAKLNFEIAPVNEVLDEALKLSMDRGELKHIKIKKDYTADPLLVHVDKEKIKLAFLNIIMNAIEAIPQDSGVLEIKTTRKNDKCIIEFTDNGSGMSEETLQRIFEPYFTSKTRGTGLGLTNTQNIILNHEGNISVQSSPGNGTTFTITLNLEKNN